MEMLDAELNMELLVPVSVMGNIPGIYLTLSNLCYVARP